MPPYAWDDMDETEVERLEIRENESYEQRGTKILFLIGRIPSGNCFKVQIGRGAKAFEAFIFINHR